MTEIVSLFGYYKCKRNRFKKYKEKAYKDSTKRQTHR